MDFAVQIGVVFAVLGAMLAALMAVRRFGWGTVSSRVPRFGTSKTRELEHLQRLALTPQHSLHLVRLGDRKVLISASPAGCQVVREEK